MVPVMMLLVRMLMLSMFFGDDDDECDCYDAVDHDVDDACSHVDSGDNDDDDKQNDEWQQKARILKMQTKNQELQNMGQT